MPVAVYQRLEPGYWFGPQTYCTEAFPSPGLHRAFILYAFLAVYMLPLLTICLCYACMLKRMGRPSVEPTDDNYQVLATISFKHQSIYQQQQKQQQPSVSWSSFFNHHENGFHLWCVL